MSNVFWYPEPIKACVLTDVINWKTFEKSYEDLCNRFGNDALQITSHQKLFNKFIRETQKLAEAQTNINEIMFNESMYLRYRILRDVIWKVPLNTSYGILCETLGDIKYQEFEFWYYRFYNGQRDLDYDRSKDPKPLTFSDLPIDVIEKIVGKSDVKSRYKLRSVSRGLKNLVDFSSLRMEKITLHLTHRPLEYLLTILGNPKLQLGVLNFSSLGFWAESELVVNFLKLLPHMLHVESLKLIGCTPQHLLEIILCVKPKVLKKLKINYPDTEPTIVHNLVESEQWKQAEEVIIDNYIFCNISRFLHFKRFDVFVETIFMDELIELRDSVSKSSNFEWCRIRDSSTRWFEPEMEHDWPSEEDIQRDLGLKKQVHNNKEYFVYNIPNSTEMLVFSFFDREFFIKKSNCSIGF